MPKAQLRQHQTTNTKDLSSAGMQIMGAAAKPAKLRHPWHHTLTRNDWRGMTDARPGEEGRDRPQRSRTPPGDQLTPGAATIIESACPTCTQVPNMRSQSRDIEHRYGLSIAQRITSGALAYRDYDCRHLQACFPCAQVLYVEPEAPALESAKSPGNQ
jgi:hypothetical protein